MNIKDKSLKKLAQIFFAALLITLSCTTSAMTARAADSTDTHTQKKKRQFSILPQDPMLYMSNGPGNNLCKDVFYLLHLPLNYNLLRDNYHSAISKEEIFQTPTGYPEIVVHTFSLTGENRLRDDAREMYEKLNYDNHQIFGYDYYAHGRSDDLDLDGKRDLVYFIAKRGLPDFGKLYLADNSPKYLRDALYSLDAVGLIGYYNRTYIVTRKKNELGIYSISTEGTPGDSQPPGTAKVTQQCYFAYRPPQDGQ